MGIAEDILGQQVVMAAHLRFGVEAPARVIQVDVSQAVEPGIVGGAKLVNRRRGEIGRVTDGEFGLCRSLSVRSVVCVASIGHEKPPCVIAWTGLRQPGKATKSRSILIRFYHV